MRFEESDSYFNQFILSIEWELCDLKLFVSVYLNEIYTEIVPLNQTNPELNVQIEIISYAICIQFIQQFQ